LIRTFEKFACFDWSGQAVAKPKGIALATAGAGAQAPALVACGSGWSRHAALNWLRDRAEDQADMLIGFDFSMGFPFVDRRAYFPGWAPAPCGARQLWREIDRVCAGDPHYAATSILTDPELAGHFRYRSNGTTVTGSQFEPGLGRLRVTEQLCRSRKLGNATSCFNLIGAAQVGKASLTGMRLLHELGSAIPVWPFDPVPASGPLLVEIYTGIAARSAGLTGPTKIRSGPALDSALERLGSQHHAQLDHYDDHRTDALLTAAWLRSASQDSALWRPEQLGETLRQTEGWTFGIG
jgi:hypothetical protein